MGQSERVFETTELIGKYLKGELTEQEALQLRHWIEKCPEHRKLWKQLSNPDYLEEQLQYWKDHQDKEEDWSRLARATVEKRQGHTVVLRKVMRYAAVLLPIMLLAGAAYVFHLRSGAAKQPGVAAIHLLPRGKVAQLILANGKVMELSDSMQKSITEKDGTKVRNQPNMLRYFSRHRRKDITLYNVLRTPRGGEYRVMLADGTKVWLNAASSLRYPVAFHGRERKVFLDGEAFFEVAKDASRPFIVQAGRAEVTVLGTRFDISCYTDDPVEKTTLVNGSVRVRGDGEATGKVDGLVLKPGFEALIRKNDPVIRVNKANISAELAWTKGLFVFDGESLGSLMRKLSRWYDVDIVYDGGVDTVFHFTGRIQRYKDIAGILHLIEMTGKVRFSMKDHELHVSPAK